MVESKHLWEVKHAYYCDAPEDTSSRFTRWADFLAEWGDADKDYNFLVRWDWDERDDNGDETFDGDVYYRNGKLLLIWVSQRKGYLIKTTADVCRADEPAVREFLGPFWKHMRELWAPLSDDPHQTEGKQDADE